MSFPTIILYIAIIIIILYIPFPTMINYCVYRKRFNKKHKNNDSVYITFDDGPDPEATQKILKILNDRDVKATFFITCINLEKYPGIISKILSGGHKIGEHGYSHLHPWKSNPITYCIDLIKSNRLIEPYKINKNSMIFRPPYGKYNIITLLYIIIFKKKVVFWDLDPQDYNEKDGKTVAEIVISKLHPGSVILLHDSRISKESSNMSVTIEAVKHVLDYIVRMGYKCALFN